MTEAYAGDLSPQEAWDFLKGNSNAILIDVRTMAEWAWVGQVDLSTLQKNHFCVEWNQFPGGSPNENFIAEVTEKSGDKDAPILLLCRSGVRSKYAAIALTEAGYKTCYNISGGFEGDHNEDRHRGKFNGWKVAGLPWAQG